MSRNQEASKAVHSRDRLALWGICLGFFVVLLDATIVNVALPAIGRSLGQSLSAQQWTLNIYTLLFAAFTLNAGAWGDRWGARRLYLGGLAVFSVGTIICGIAPDTWTLLAGRAVQGFGAAAVVPCSLTLIMHRFPEGGARARALGAWGGISGIGLAAGPVLGGFLVDSVGWRGVFFVAVPVAVLSGALVLATVKKSRKAPRTKADMLGQLVAVIVLAALNWALTSKSSPGEGGRWSITFTVIGIVSAIGFVLIERRVREPMVPMGMFREANFSIAISIGALFNFGLYGTLFCLALYLQNGLHLSAQSAGLALLPLTVVIAVCATLSGHLTALFGARVPMLVGLSAGAIGSGLLAISDSDTPIGLIVTYAAVFGAIGTAMPAMTSVALNASPHGRAGLGSGVLNAARQTGGLIGVALLGSVLEMQPGLPSLHVAMTLVAAGFLVAVVFATQARLRKTATL